MANTRITVRGNFCIISSAFFTSAGDLISIAGAADAADAADADADADLVTDARSRRRRVTFGVFRFGRAILIPV